MDKNLYIDEFYESGIYDYARFLAFSYYADFTVDNNGEEFCCGCTDEGLQLFVDIRKGTAIFPFSKEKYDSNTDVQNSLAALGLDPEKFWHALLYAYHEAESQNTDCIQLKPAVQEHIKAILDVLKQEGAKITVQNSDTKYVVSDENALDFIREMLEQGDCANRGNGAYVLRRGPLLGPRDDIAVSWQMEDFYESMSRVIEKYRTDEELPPRVAGQVGSRDKKLLISRLLYMVRLTESKAYLNNTNSINGLKNYWRNTSRPLKSSTYWFDYGTDTDSSDTDSSSDNLSGPTIYVQR